MNLEELLAREGIRKTIANYTMAGDRLKTDAFVAVFTEDGIIETEPKAAPAVASCGSCLRRLRCAW